MAATAQEVTTRRRVSRFDTRTPNLLQGHGPRRWLVHRRPWGSAAVASPRGRRGEARPWTACRLRAGDREIGELEGGGLAVRAHDLHPEADLTQCRVRGDATVGEQVVDHRLDVDAAR